MSNRYAEALAAVVDAELPESVTVEAREIWPGSVFWRHVDGGGGLIDLYRVLRRPVDNRRRPTDCDRDRLIELIIIDARRQAADPRYTDKARKQAVAARDALGAHKAPEEV